MIPEGLTRLFYSRKLYTAYSVQNGWVRSVVGAFLLWHSFSDLISAILFSSFLTYLHFSPFSPFLHFFDSPKKMRFLPSGCRTRGPLPQLGAAITAISMAHRAQHLLGVSQPLCAPRVELKPGPGGIQSDLHFNATPWAVPR